MFIQVTVEPGELQLLRVEKGSRNSLIFHVIHKPTDMIGQYVMFGYVKTLDNFRLQCRWRYPEKGDQRLCHCPAFVNLIAAKEIQMEEQKRKKNFITGKFEDIGGTAANKKLSHTGNGTQKYTIGPNFWDKLYIMYRVSNAWIRGARIPT